jgi:sugar O-acyltransferase (sialic acid O-acetyltransferase NeuD family)
VVLLGAGGHGREVLDIIEAQAAAGSGETVRVLGFLSDYPVDEEPLDRRGQRVLGEIALLADLDADYILAIGNGVARAAVDERVRHLGRRSLSARHPDAVHAATARSGDGLVMAAGSSLGGRAVVGARVHLNTNAAVAADTRLGNDVTVSPGAVIGRGAEVGDGVFVGAGALVAEGVRVGPDTMIGAGAIVTTDVGGSATMVGSPARSS